LLPHEAAYVLQVSVRCVRNQLRRGELAEVGPDRRRRLDPDQVAEMVSDRPLALEVLAGILDGRVRVPRCSDPDAQVRSLMESWSSLW